MDGPVQVIALMSLKRDWLPWKPAVVAIVGATIGAAMFGAGMLSGADPERRPCDQGVAALPHSQD
jgi:hypothetical protein